MFKILAKVVEKEGNLMKACIINTPVTRPRFGKCAALKRNNRH